MPDTALGLLGFGFLLGLRHALDVDHLAAVSTFVTQRRSVWSSSLVGAVWGLGHTVSLLAMGIVVIGLHTEVPPRVANALELAVGAMLVGLGLNLLATVRRGGRLHAHDHEHGSRRHVHLHVHAGVPVDGTHHHPVRAARRPFLVGVVHGLAGSAALMLAVLTTIPSPPLALAYVAVFGIGSIGGMMAMSTLVGVPLARFARAELALRTCAAIGSVAVGVLVVWEIAVRSAVSGS